MEDPVEVLPPSRNLILVAVRTEHLRHHIPFPLLDDPLLHCGHGSAIEGLVSQLLSMRINGSTYTVSSSIAPSTDLLSSSNRLPSKPRARTVHISEQTSPRLT